MSRCLIDANPLPLFWWQKLIKRLKVNYFDLKVQWMFKKVFNIKISELGKDCSP